MEVESFSTGSVRFWVEFGDVESGDCWDGEPVEPPGTLVTGEDVERRDWD